MSQDVRAYNPAALDHLQQMVKGGDALLKKINRIEGESDKHLAQKAAAHGVSLTDDPYLLEDGDEDTAPVIRAVSTPAKVAPIRVIRAPSPDGQAQCRPGLCDGNPACNDRECHRHPAHDTSASLRRFAPSNEQASALVPALLVVAVFAAVMAAVFVNL